MEGVSETDADGREAGLGQSTREVARSEDPDVAARGLEVIVPSAQIEVLARCGWDGDRDEPSRFCLLYTSDAADE